MPTKKPKKETVAKKSVAKKVADTKVTAPIKPPPKKAEHPDAPQLRAEWDAHLNDVNANEVDRAKLQSRADAIGVTL